MSAPSSASWHTTNQCYQHSHVRVMGASSHTIRYHTTHRITAAQTHRLHSPLLGHKQPLHTPHLHHPSDVTTPLSYSRSPTHPSYAHATQQSHSQWARRVSCAMSLIGSSRGEQLWATKRERSVTTLVTAQTQHSGPQRQAHTKRTAHVRCQHQCTLRLCTHPHTPAPALATHHREECYQHTHGCPRGLQLSYRGSPRDG